MFFLKSLLGMHFRARRDQGSPQTLVGPGLLVIALLVYVPHAGAQSAHVHCHSARVGEERRVPHRFH